MPYYTSQYTQASFTAELAQSLSDPNLTYWSQDELNRALNEALLCWGALTSYWTTRGEFVTVPSPLTPFYDLSAVLLDGSGDNVRRREYTFGNLTREMQYHLLEPASGVSGTGMTSQFTVSQLTSALLRRRNQFVIDSRIPLTTAIVTGGLPSDPSVQLPQDISLIARAAWRDAVTGVITPLRRSDTLAAQAYNPIWNLSPSPRPYGYSQVESMPGRLLLTPPPLSSGTIHLTYAQTVNPVIADGTSLAVPDEFAWALKYGALYECVSTTSQGYDPLRAKYCLERYSSAVALAAAHRSVIRVYSNNVPLPLDTLASLDSAKPYWQSTPGRPQLAGAAYDLLAFYRVPNSVFSITCDAVQTAPLPVAPADPVDVGREELPYLFDYCRHILCLKQGGEEFLATMPLYDNFLRGASQRNSLIASKARYLTPLFSTSALQQDQENAA